MIDMHIYCASHISWKVLNDQNPTSTAICIIERDRKLAYQLPRSFPVFQENGSSRLIIRFS
jgi:hypothetical protein